MGLLQKDAGALRADFRKHYGVRLRDEMHADIFEAADMAANLPRDGSSAIFRAINTEWQWTLDAQLLALNADYLAWLRWFKTKDGRKGRNKPKPIPRPGVAKEASKADDRFAEAEGLPREEFMEWMKKMGVREAV